MIFRFVFGLLAIVFMASSAFAHPTKEAETEIRYNMNSGKVEIVHRFHINDAEQAVQLNYGTGLDLVNDAKAQASFGAYIEDRFSLLKDGKVVPLTLVGGELDDGSVWIYQETDALDATASYSMENTALMDTFSDQRNTVYIRLNGQTQTFTLSKRMPIVHFRLK